MIVYDGYNVPPEKLTLMLNLIGSLIYGLKFKGRFSKGLKVVFPIMTYISNLTKTY